MNVNFKLLELQSKQNDVFETVQYAQLLLLFQPHILWAKSVMPSSQKTSMFFFQMVARSATVNTFLVHISPS